MEEQTRIYLIEAITKQPIQFSSIIDYEKLSDIDLIGRALVKLLTKID